MGHLDDPSADLVGAPGSPVQGDGGNLEPGALQGHGAGGSDGHIGRTEFLGEAAVGIPPTEHAVQFAFGDGCLGLFLAVVMPFGAESVGDAGDEMLADLDLSVRVPAFRKPIEAPVAHRRAALQRASGIVLDHESRERDRRVGHMQSTFAQDQSGALDFDSGSRLRARAQKPGEDEQRQNQQRRDPASGSDGTTGGR
jgi:hypothetical protein